MRKQQLTNNINHEKSEQHDSNYSYHAAQIFIIFIFIGNQLNPQASWSTGLGGENVQYKGASV